MRSERNGFTLIELLIVVVIIGILAAIAVPKFGATKDKAKLASVKSDLRNLVSAQEAYISDNGSYYGGPIPDPTFAYQPSAGVTVTMDGINGASGWGATATYSGSTQTCAIFYGGYAPVAPAVTNGAVACTTP